LKTVVTDEWLPRLMLDLQRDGSGTEAMRRYSVQLETL
jgi:hypothetical protein